MRFRKFLTASSILLALTLTANVASGLRQPLTESKDQLKLKYDLAITDCGNGRVMIVLTISDEGRLAPLDAVELAVNSKDSTGQPEVWLSMAIRKQNGKQTASVELMRDLAQRAELYLLTSHVDGKQTTEECEYPIRVADYLAQEKK
jgi:hypothetical protein